MNAENQLESLFWEVEQQARPVSGDIILSDIDSTQICVWDKLGNGECFVQPKTYYIPFFQGNNKLYYECKFIYLKKKHKLEKFV